MLEAVEEQTDQFGFADGFLVITVITSAKELISAPVLLPPGASECKTCQAGTFSNSSGPLYHDRSFTLMCDIICFEFKVHVANIGLDTN